ncbi:MAG: ubiquitin-like small modifier protein 1 [Halobacteriaceae archaeon]
MRWRLFADLAEIVGDREVRLTVEGETVADALDGLLKRHPELEDRIFEDQRLADHVNLLQNGEDATMDDGIDEGDELALFPPVSGG